MVRFAKWSLVVALFCSFKTFAQHSRIFPQPQAYAATDNVFEFGGELLIAENEDLKPMFVALQKQFKTEQGVSLNYCSATQKPTINITRWTNYHKEGYYRMEIAKDGIQIAYTDQEGLFYAFQSLIQQMTNSQTIEGAELEDWPLLGYRGAHLDCARHFFTIPELEGFIDQLARLKFNKFHWHLTDDQGWRLEIKKYPKLTEVGAWRDSTLIGHFSKTPVEYDHEKYGGFYTQEEAKSLVEYAKVRGIEIIPEIEMPGHARAALAAYPELGCTGIQQDVAGTWGVFDDVFCSKEETLRFLENVLDEVIAIFPSKTIHVGGDESPKVRWEVCPACQKQIKDHGLRNEHELQSFVIQRMSNYLNAKGRMLMGWDEILEGGLAENAQVMSWRGTEGGIAAAKTGHQVVMTPTSYCYFDYYQSGSPGEPLAIGGYLPLEKVYAFQPVPKELTESEKQFVLGGQANLWTEYLPTMHAVYYMEFPRLVAMAEVLWTDEKNRKTYDEFVVGLNNYVFPYFEKRQINYSRAAFEPKVNWDQSEGGIELSINYPLKEAFVGFYRGPIQTRVFRIENLPVPYLFLDRTKDTITQDYDARVIINGEVAGESKVKITTHLALGKEVNFKTPPSEKYNVHGNLGLTDGVKGQMPWKGNQWLGFEEDTVCFDLDLGIKTKFGAISLGVLNDPGSWIYAPKELKIEYSSDGKKWIAIDDVNYNQATAFEMKKKLNTRFLRFTVINAEKIPEGLPGAGFTPWTFLDELIITR